uniref:Uncharacterized protein n=1 Tax=Rhizobium rhizogenes TaxID=359 RepID=A0A7S4ZSU7_RHIRH|nr:hypothetical protein pC6.5d_670 [Rhizobium rhizogenes]
MIGYASGEYHCECFFLFDPASLRASVPALYDCEDGNPEHGNVAGYKRPDQRHRRQRWQD